MTPTKVNLTIYQGATFAWPFYWYSDTEVIVAISAVARSYPTLVTAVAHGLPSSAVPVALLDVPTWLKTQGVKAADRVLANGDTAYATKVDVDTFSVKLDGTGQLAYSGSAGRLVYNAPMDLSVWDARMQVRESADSDTVLVAFTVSGSEITLGADGRVQLSLDAVATDALTFSNAVYDLELVDPNTSEVTRLAEGKVTLKPQVTR